MSRVAAQLVESTGNRLIVVAGMVLEVQRVDSDMLRREGWAALEGASSVREALERIRQEQQAERSAFAGTPEEVRVARSQHNRELAEKSARRTLEAMLSRPEGQVEFLRRCTAYLCAAVVRLGVARPDLELPIQDPTVGPFALLPPGTPAPDVAKDLRTEEEAAAGAPPVFLEPGGFVRLREQEDAAAGRVWAHRLSEAQRMAVGSAILSLQSVAVSVRPFRGAAGDHHRDPPRGEGVREVAPRGPEARAGGPGAGDRVRRAGGRKRGAPGGAVPDGVPRHRSG